MSNIDNLKPFDSERAREAGKKSSKKGSKHLKTLIQEIGNDIEWNKTTLKDKDKMKKLYGNNGWKALVYVAFTKGLAGDTKALDWLAKNGYGTNIDITSNGEQLNIAMVEFIGDDPTDRTQEN